MNLGNSFDPYNVHKLKESCITLAVLLRERLPGDTLSFITGLQETISMVREARIEYVCRFVVGIDFAIGCLLVLPSPPHLSRCSFLTRELIP